MVTAFQNAPLQRVIKINIVGNGSYSPTAGTFAVVYIHNIDPDASGIVQITGNGAAIPLSDNSIDGSYSMAVGDSFEKSIPELMLHDTMSISVTNNAIFQGLALEYTDPTP